MASKLGLDLLDLADPRIRTLHFAWFAFFLTFVLWFNHPPLLAYIRETLQMSEAQVRALLTLNVALTIPARILVGILVDRFGPRAVFSALLVLGSLVCFGFAAAQSFEQLALARFGMGLVGAGFVIGIRLVGEWFPARQVGLAEGIYGGWGNFGAAAASLSLPSLALLFGKEQGWRWAIAATGVASLGYAFLFHARVRNTPLGSTYFKPRRTGGLEVTSRSDFLFCLAMNLPLYAALAVLAWNLSPGRIGLISTQLAVAIWIGLAALGGLHFSQIYRVNREMLGRGAPEPHRYRFTQVAVLDLVYLITFGSELAVVSVLPLYFLDTFAGLDPVKAGLLASPFAFMNLVARPGGGWLSDRFGRRRTLAVLLGGAMLSYLMLGALSGSWPLALVVLATVACSFFVHAGNGAVFAVVPLVQRRMTGQIAGMVGAYGNVGGVFFLTVFSFVDYATFFQVIAASAALGLLALPFLEEPRGHVAEVNEDGSVALIKVA